MDLSIQDWGALGEIIGAVGVIATLLFLAVQIRANTKESRLTATAEIARDYNTYLQHLTADEDLSRLWRNAVDGDVQTLRDDEQARVFPAILRQLQGMTDARGHRLQVHVIPGPGRFEGEDGELLPTLRPTPE